MAKEVIVNLNGKTITAPSDPSYRTCAFCVKSNSILTINGEGNIYGNQGGLENNALSIEGGTVIINGGNFSVGRNKDDATNTCIYLRTKGSRLEINNGTFYAPSSNFEKYGHVWHPIINVANSLRKTQFKVLIKGGTFYGYNPAEGDETTGGNFVADGFVSVKEGNYVDAEGNVLPIYIVKKQ